MNLQDFREQYSWLDGLSDESALNVLHETFYPKEDKAALAKGLGVSLKSEEKGTGGFWKDAGITALKSAISVPEAAVGLADMVTMGGAGRLAEEAGFRPKEAKAMLDEGYSDRQKAAFKAVQDAEGFTGKMAAALENPSVIAHSVGESIAPMLAGGVVARGLMGMGAAGVSAGAGGVGPVVPGMMARTFGQSAPMVAGAVGEGVMGAGSAAEQIRQQTPDGYLTGEQAALAGATGVATTAFGLLGGKIAQRMGIGDVDTMLVGAARDPGMRKGVVRSFLEGAASEGILEELPQSVSEQVLQNAALGKPLDEGVDQAAVLGLLSGGVMGGGAGAFGSLGSAPKEHPADIAARAQADALRSTKQPETGALTKAVNAGTEAQAQKVEAAGASIATADKAMADMERQAQRDLQGLRDFASKDGFLGATVQSPTAPLQGAQTLDGAAEVVDSPFSDRILNLKEQLADPANRERVRSRWGDQGLSDILYYAGVSDRTDIPERTQENMLTLAERLMSESLLTPIQRGTEIGGAVRDPLVIGNEAPAAQTHAMIGMNQARSGRFTVDAQGKAVPETTTQQSDAQRRAQDIEAMGKAQTGKRSAVAPALGTRMSGTPMADMLGSAQDPVSGILSNRRQAVQDMPSGMAPRTRTDGQALTLPTADPVRDYVDNMRQVNTPAAKFYVREFDAGRITPADVQQRMTVERGKTPDERLADAAAQAPKNTAQPGDILNPKGEPFKTLLSARLAAKKTPGDVIEVVGGYSVRPRTEVTNAQATPVPASQPQADAGTSTGVEPMPTPAQAEPVAVVAAGQPEQAQPLSPRDSRKLQEAHKALGYGVTQPQVQSMRDRVAAEVETGTTNNGGVVGKLTPIALKMRKAKLERLDADLALFGNAPTAQAMQHPIQQQQAQPLKPKAAVPQKETAAIPPVETPAPVVEQEPASVEGWTELKNGFNNRPVYRKDQGVGKPFAVVQRNGINDFSIEIRHGDKRLSQEDVVGKKADVLANAQARLDAASGVATHKDPGQKAEVATPAVVSSSLTKAAKREDVKPADMKKWLLGELNKAMLEAPDRNDFDDTVKSYGKADAEKAWSGSGIFGKDTHTGFLNFDVPGDGKFKVRNGMRGLLEFKQNVERSKGFSNTGARTAAPERNNGVQGGSGGQMSAITNMIDEGDFEAARDYAEAVGINLDDVKVPRGERKPQWDAFRKNGTLPPQPDTKPLPPQKTAAELDAEKKAAREAEANKPGDTGWNMAGTGYAGKRYIGRKIKLADGREIVARVYENAGAYEEAEVMEGGKVLLRLTDRYRAQERVDAWLDRLIGKTPAMDLMGFKMEPMDDEGSFRLLDGNMVVSVERTDTGLQARHRSAKSSPHLTDQQAVEWAANIRDDGKKEEARDAAPKGRTYLAVPFEDKDNAKQYGAKWDADKKLWFADPLDDGEINLNLQKFIPRDSIADDRFNYYSKKDVATVVALNASNRDGVEYEVKKRTHPDGIVMWSVMKPAVEVAPAAQPASQRRDPTKVSMFNPYEDGDTVTIDGQDWTVKQDTPGWYLTNTGNWRGTHPTIRNITAMQDLIRAVEQAFVAKEVAAKADTNLNGTTERREKLTGDDRWDQIPSRQNQSAEDTEAQNKVVAYMNGDITRTELMTYLEKSDLPQGKIFSFTQRLQDDGPSMGEVDAMIARREQASPAQAEATKLTQAEAADLMEWVALGTKDGVTKHVLGFYESKADKDALRGRMTIATITKGDRSANAFTIDGDDQRFGSLAIAKKRAMEIGMAKAVSDGFVEAGEVAAKPAAKTEAQKPSSKIDDFGEKIAGAKKDLWTGFKDELSAVADDDISNQPLAKVWPAPGYQALIDGGASPEVVAFIRAARDEVPAKPRVAYKVKAWSSKVRTLRGLAVDLMAGKVSMKEVETMLERSGAMSRSMQGFMGRVDLYKAVGHEKSLDGIRMAWHNFTLYRGQKNVSLWVVEKDAAATAFSNWPRELATGKTKEEAIDAFRKAYDKLDADKETKKGVQFDIVSYGGETGYWITKKLGRNNVKVHGPLATVKEAREYRDQNQSSLVAKLEKIKEIPAERRDVNDPRVGEDMRGGADVTPQMFGDTFGFKGVQFGNWVEQGRRQQDLNNAFDALMDMAAVLGIPAKAISLDGQLGLAFGARGSGGSGMVAAAHYEPDKVVINLTKKNGAGSLGHEWWHAVDNYFAKMRKGRGGDFMTVATDVKLAARDAGYQSYDGVRVEMVKAFGNVVKAINLTGMKKRAAVLDGKRSKDYWTTGEEMSARSFEAYLIAKLQDQNASNDYLANILSEGAWDAAAALGLENENSYPYPTAKEVPGIRAAFDQFFQTVQAKETENGNVALFSQNLLSQKLGPKPALDQIERFVQRVQDVAKNVIPITVVGNPAQINVLDVPDGSNPTGALINGQIYLFADNIKSVGDAYSTLFHEIFHLGLQKVIPAEAYSALLNKFAASPMVAKYVRMWKQSPEGIEKAGTMQPEAYDALANEEALAMVSEALAAAQNIGSNKLPGLVKRMLSWMAQVADKIGFPANFGNWMRGLTQTAAERFVSDMTRAVLGGEKNLAKTQAKYGTQYAQLTSQNRFSGGRGTTTVMPETQAPGPQGDAQQGAVQGNAVTRSLLDVDGWRDAPEFQDTDSSTVMFHGGSDGYIPIVKDMSNSAYARWPGLFASLSVQSAHGPGQGNDITAFRIQNDKMAWDFDNFDQETVRQALMRLLPRRVEQAVSQDDDLLDVVWTATVDDRFSKVGDEFSELFGLEFGEAGWEAQSIRGRLATEMGLDAIAMSDEHGTSWYIGPGVKSIPLPSVNESSTPTSQGGRFRQSSNVLKDTAKAVTDRLGQNFSAPGKISWWDKTVGSMYHMAERYPAFKPVYEAAQNFINDVSYYGTEAANMAPRLLPKLDTWNDLMKSAISAADNDAVAAPVFEGTLVWARDESGKLIKIDDLAAKYADLSDDQKARMLLRKNVVSEAQLKAWKASPLDIYEGAIRNRFEESFLKAGVVFTDAELKSHFKLNDGQVALYREFRASADASLDNMTKADMLRIAGKDLADMRNDVMEADLDTAAAMVREKLLNLAREYPDRDDVLTKAASDVLDRAAKAGELKLAGYAPLSRFGKYTVDVVVDGERKFFSLYESAADASRAAAQMRAEFGDGNVEQGTLSQREFELFQGITPESLELFGNMLGLDSTGDDAQDKAFQDYLRLTKSNRSALKRLIHRKGVDGYSEDVGRVLASFVYSNARQTAAALHIGDMGEAIAAIPKGDGELKDAAIELGKYVKEPREEAHALRGLLFAQYLGGSVASAMVNFTQPLAVSIPYLSQFGGIRKAAFAWRRAVSDMAQGKELEPALAKAMKVAEEKGVVSPQEVHQLMAQARGAASLRSGDGTVAGDLKAAGQNSIAKMAVAWGKLFGFAEQINRRSTFIAAYRLAVDKGIADPAAFAEKAVNETQFVNNKGNKMKWGRGAIGATAMTFKSYSLNWLELMHRLATQNGTEGKWAAAYMLGALVLMSGAGGLPFAGDAEDVIDGIAQRLGYNFSSKKAKQQFLEDTFGKTAAGFIDKGITGIPGVPIDIAGRTGMGNLIPGTGLFLKKTDHTRDVMEFAGPAGDLITRGFTAADQLASGEPMKAAKTIAPKAVGNLIQGVDMANSGMYKDAKGYKVLDADMGEAIGKMIGFQPHSVANIQEAAYLEQRGKDFYNMHKQTINAKWANGIFTSDQAEIQEARDMVKAWNENNPDQRITVSMPIILKRVREMRKDKAQRIADTAPKAMRAAMREDLRRAATVD